MRNKSFLALILSLILIFSIIGIHLSLDKILFAPDGQNHYKYSTEFDECDSGYANGICWMTNWMNLTPFGFWLIFFIISLLIPISFVLYTKNLWIFPAFFIFTGIFWNVMVMQVFAQLIVSLVFVFFIFEKDRSYRVFILELLWIVWIWGIEFHNSIHFVLLAITIYEIISFFWEKYEEILDKETKELNKLNFGVIACGVLSKESVSKVAGSTGKIRQAMNNKIGTLLDNIVYYSYSFFWENMFIGFVIPGIYEIFNTVDFKKIYYFLFIIFGALFLWFLDGWKIWWVTRVLIWLPLVLFVPFVEWLERQKHSTKTIFIFMGLCYFLFNIWYFLNKIQNMGCGL